MIDHIGIVVSDFERARLFYSEVLASLDMTVVMDLTPAQTGGGAHIGFGSAGKAVFWLGDRGHDPGAVHIAFVAASRAAVDAFHQAGLRAGGSDNGRPGLRPHYHPDHYAAFVRDHDGNNIEAVCRRAE